jgi:hypothetical protein
VVLPHAVQRRPATAHHGLDTVPRLAHALPAGSRTQGHPRGHAGVRRHPQPCAARRARPPGHDLSGVLPAGAGGCRRVQAGAGGCRRASGRGARASGGASAPTRSPTRRTATAPGWRTAVWCCRRSDASPWGGPGRCSRPVQGSIKTVTVAREADGWYICCSCAEGPTQPLALTGRETGIDVGLKVLLITAEGQSVANPRHYRTAERALKTAQQRVSRRTKGSHRRRKAVRGVARTH